MPVVINAGGQPEIVENEKNGFLWNTTEELTERTELLMSDEKLRQEMSGEAMKRAKYFGVDKFRQKLKEIIGI